MRVSLGSVSVFEVGIGFSVFFEVGSVFSIGISKYRDSGIGIRYFFHVCIIVRSIWAGSLLPLYCRTSTICTHLYNVQRSVTFN